MSKQLATPRDPRPSAGAAVNRAAARPDTTADRDAAYRLQFTVGRLARRLRREIDTDLTPSQLTVLSTVHRCGPLTLGELAECERVAPPTITRVVSKLEEQGYLERLPDPGDRRIVRVQVSAKADELVARARRVKADWVLDRLDRLPPRQRRRLLAAVDALEELADME